MNRSDVKMPGVRYLGIIARSHLRSIVAAAPLAFLVVGSADAQVTNPGNNHVALGQAISNMHGTMHQTQHGGGIRTGIAPAINTYHAPPHSATNQGRQPNSVVRPGGPFDPAVFGFQPTLEQQQGIGFAAAAPQATPIRRPSSNAIDVTAQSLTTDAFVASELAAANWAPGGKNFPDSFNDRGTLDFIAFTRSEHFCGR